MFPRKLDLKVPNNKLQQQIAKCLKWVIHCIKELIYNIVFLVQFVPHNFNPIRSNSLLNPRDAHADLCSSSGEAHNIYIHTSCAYLVKDVDLLHHFMKVRRNIDSLWWKIFFFMLILHIMECISIQFCIDLLYLRV